MTAVLLPAFKKQCRLIECRHIEAARSQENHLTSAIRSFSVSAHPGLLQSFGFPLSYYKRRMKRHGLRSHLTRRDFSARYARVASTGRRRPSRNNGMPLRQTFQFCRSIVRRSLLALQASPPSGRKPISPAASRSDRGLKKASAVVSQIEVFGSLQFIPDGDYQSRLPAFGLVFMLCPGRDRILSSV